ncbi:ABC transporter ATP-binding protein [Streptococcus entericus]|uniref:ABC transporter ATP-binding protein n=1 Tax=Streptococcus entericus TaxID=155680 RepID=UPI0003781C4F|nr:ABC transporter ATP-binding protein [Streptococcus entericus]
MLRVENITGGYHHLPVLTEVSFEVKSGELVGLIGLNGAGKSTTIKEIIGLLRPDKGRISLGGLTLADDAIAYRKKIGFIPESPSLYNELTLREHLETVALAYDLPIELVMTRAEGLLTLFRLSDKLDWFPTDFSKGMQQKVMLICAFVVEPELFIIDEPFLGLDPQAIADLMTLLAEQKAAGKAILMSTHVLDTAERICDRFVLLHQGRVLAQGSLADLREQFGDHQASLNSMYLHWTREA